MYKTDFGGKVGALEHIGLLVEDVHKAVESLSVLPDAEPWEFVDMDFSKEKYTVGSMYKMKVAFGMLAGVPCEMIQPIEDPEGKMGLYMTNYLKTHGEGMHHLAYTYINEEEYRKAYRKNLEGGGESVMECELIENRDTPEEQVVYACYVVPKNSGVVYEMNARIPTNRIKG